MTSTASFEQTASSHSEVTCRSSFPRDRVALVGREFRAAGASFQDLQDLRILCGLAAEFSPAEISPMLADYVLQARQMQASAARPLHLSDPKDALLELRVPGVPPNLEQLNLRPPTLPPLLEDPPAASHAVHAPPTQTRFLASPIRR
jgi:hypothetical protein